MESLSKRFKNSKDFQPDTVVMSPKSDERAVSTVNLNSAPLSCTETSKNHSRNDIKSTGIICEGKLLAVSKRSPGKSANCVRNLWTALEKNGIPISRKI